MSSVINPFERDFPRIIGGLVKRYNELGGVAGHLLNGADIGLQQTGYDNWDGGTYRYEVICRVRPELYWRHENQISVVASMVLEALTPLIQPYRSDIIDSVLILPALEDADATDESAEQRKLALSEPRFWRSGHFRLFISHRAEEKVFAQQLSEGLLGYGISGFVAHEDIEPTREWENEIITALRTMDGLLAILSSTFHASEFTDQEVGAAIGRDKPILTLRNGSDPYGLMARGQALKTKGPMTVHAAKEIATTLLAHEQSSSRMAEGIVASFIASDSFDQARSRVRNLSWLEKVTDDQRARIEKALVENGQIRNAYNVVPEATSFLKRAIATK
jgi:hypothetical protein